MTYWAISAETSNFAKIRAQMSYRARETDRKLRNLAELESEV